MMAVREDAHTGTTPREEWYARLAVGGLVLAIALVFFGLMLQHTRGHLSPPLDDTLIYFQYARQIAHGHVFVYVNGDQATSGSTSFLYPFVLAVGYLAGFRDDRLVVFAFTLNLAFFAASIMLTLLIARRLMAAVPAWSAAALVAVNGWVAWTVFSMMEAGLHTVAILLALYLFMRARESARSLLLLSATLALLPFVRPELCVLAALIGVVVIFHTPAQWHDRSAALQRGAPLASAIAGTTAYFVLMKLITGSARANTYVAKSVLSNPFLTWSEKLSTVANNFGEHLNFAFTFFGPSYVATAAFALATIGAVALVREDVADRRITIRTLIPALFIAGLITASFTSVSSVHFHRFAAPYEPLAAVLVVRGLVAALAAFTRAPAFGWPLAAAVVGIAVIPTVPMANAYGQNTSDIYFQHETAGRWLRDNTRSDTVVAVNDAGGIPYYGRRRVYDIIGLVTRDSARPYIAGQASVYERIENLPEQNRPGLYVIYLGHAIGFSELGFLTQIHAFVLDRKTIAAGAAKIVYRPDNSLLGSGDLPGELPFEASDWRIVDRLDVADLDSEDTHDYSTKQREVGITPLELLFNRTYAGASKRIIDGGRANLSESFELQPEPGKPYVVVVRSLSAYNMTVRVTADDARADIPVTLDTNNWRDIVVARGANASDKLRVTVATTDGGQPFASYSYWLLQPE